MSVPRIVVFDDVAKNLKDIVSTLKEGVGRKASIIPFQGSSIPDAAQSYEERLGIDLVDPKNAPDLIVADRDLSSYKDWYPGLSESTVRIAATRLGIPEVGYARETSDIEDLFLDEGTYGNACIRLKLPASAHKADFSKKILSIAQGFSEILAALRKLSDKKQLTLSSNVGAGILAQILGKPEYSDKMAMYASGDKNRLALWIKILKESDPQIQLKKLACFYGYWLWDSLLRFPGLVVNEVAAGSYLNISTAAFKKADVQAVFSKAAYKGPFADALGGLWWRGALDDLIAESDFPDGNALAKSRLKRAIPVSQCCEDSKSTAGYYCFFSNLPVSFKNSTTGLDSFPRGSDLTRISRTKSEEVLPWLP